MQKKKFFYLIWQNTMPACLRRQVRVGSSDLAEGKSVSSWMNLPAQAGASPELAQILQSKTWAGRRVPCVVGRSRRHKPAIFAKILNRFRKNCIGCLKHLARPTAPMLWRAGKGGGFYIIFFFIFLVIIGFLATYKSLDPDFGWHLKTGQLILERGIPHQDWYSYTMPNFPWIDHEWLTDILIYKIYSIFGLYFLLLVFLILYTLSFFIVGQYHYNFWNFALPAIFGYLATINFLGIRPQLLTILFIAILWKITNKFLDNSSKLIYFLPILFIIWVNLHGGFFAGLFILSVILILETFKKFGVHKKIKYLNFLERFNLREQPFSKISTLLGITIFSFLATAINPYGLRIYEEVFRTVGDNFIRFHIQEWMPLLFIEFNPFIYIYIGLFTGFLMISYKKVGFNGIIISLAFLILSLSGARYFLIFIIITIPIFQEMLYHSKDKISLKKNYNLMVNFDKGVFALFLVLLILLCGYFFYGYFVVNKYYPEGSVSFLKTLPLSENLFNEYGWGGYLIWKIPERKLFIDGRMPTWKENGQFIFGDYIKIMGAESGFEKILEKYNVSLALIPKSKEGRQNVEKDIKIEKFSEKHPWLIHIYKGISKNKNLYVELKKLSWKTIYQDDVAVILRK